MSFALNDRPGLSVATRERILSIAKEVGWYPSSAARALQGSRVNACGLVLARPAETLAFEPFFMGLVAGIESELASRSIALTIQVVDRLEAELKCTAAGVASDEWTACSCVDLRVNDPRPDALVRLGLPAVILVRFAPCPLIANRLAKRSGGRGQSRPVLGRARAPTYRPCGWRCRLPPDEIRNAAYLATIKSWVLCR